MTSLKLKFVGFLGTHSGDKKMLFSEVSRNLILVNMHRGAFLTSPLSTGPPTAQP
jgi:hypothetical protein